MLGFSGKSMALLKNLQLNALAHVTFRRGLETRLAVPKDHNALVVGIAQSTRGR